MKIIDLHCDTITREHQNNESFFCNEGHIDIKKLQAGQYMLQTFAVFTKYNEKNRKEYCQKYIQRYHQMLEDNQEYVVGVNSYQDIAENNNKIKTLLSLEEGDVIDDIRDLQKLYHQGVKMVTLTWNYENRLASPATPLNRLTRKNQGLTQLGKEYIQELERLGIIIDVSHLHDQGVRDILEITTKPIIASHSNVRHLCNHPRNLSDELIQAIASRGGIIGINFYHAFLNKNGKSEIKDMIKHIDYIINLVGDDFVALGTDFDGIDGPLEIKDASEIQKLVVALNDAGFTTAQIEKICYKNCLRVFKEILK